MWGSYGQEFTALFFLTHSVLSALFCSLNAAAGKCSVEAMHKSLRRRHSTACKWIVVSYTLWLQTDLRTETSQFPIPEHCCASHYRSFSGDHFHAKNSEAALLQLHCSIPRMFSYRSTDECPCLHGTLSGYPFSRKANCLSISGRSLLFVLRIVKCTVHLGCGRWPKIDSEFFGLSWQATDLHVGSLRE